MSVDFDFTSLVGPYSESVIDTLTSASKAADFRVDCVHFKERRTSNTRNRLSELNLPPYSTAPTLYTVVAENYVPY